jgi:hypothetical protein
LLTGTSHAYLKDHRQLHGKTQVYLCSCTFFSRIFEILKYHFKILKIKSSCELGPIAFSGEPKDYMFI